MCLHAMLCYLPIKQRQGNCEQIFGSRRFTEMLLFCIYVYVFIMWSINQIPFTMTVLHQNKVAFATEPIGEFHYFVTSLHLQRSSVPIQLLPLTILLTWICTSFRARTGEELAHDHLYLVLGHQDNRLDCQHADLRLTFSV